MMSVVDNSNESGDESNATTITTTNRNVELLLHGSTNSHLNSNNNLINLEKRVLE